MALLAPSLAAGQGDGPLELRPGDIVDIRVWLKPDLSGEFRVAADGSLADPYYSAVNVAGVPFATAAQRIREYIARTEANPRVWIEPRYRVTVTGAVGSPNLYTVREATSVSEALLQAGGISDRGIASRVELHRGGERSVLDLSDPLSADAVIPVQPGDRIVVPTRGRSLLTAIVPFTTTIAAFGTLVNMYLVLTR